MIGRPASAYGSAAAAARNASLRLRHHGLPLHRDGRSPSPRSAPRGTSPPASVPDQRDSVLNRLRLRRAARAPPPTSPPTRILPFASDARAELRRVRLNGIDASPSPPSSPASAFASAARQAVDRAIGVTVLCPSSTSTAGEALQLSRPSLGTPSPPLASTAAREAIERAIRGMVLPPSSASTTDDALQRRRPCGEAPSSLLPSPPREEHPSASASATREVLDRTIRGTGLSLSSASASAFSAREVLCRTLTASSPQVCLASTSISSLLDQYHVTSTRTLRASLALSLPNKPRDEEISGPVLIITNPEFSGSMLFFPYSMKAFTRSNFPIDTDDVLYSDGGFFLLKEGTCVSIWEIKSEKTRQRVFGEQVDNADDEQHAELVIVAEFWLRTNNGAWRQNAVVCAHLGIHSLIIHGDCLFWLSDDGALCSVRQTENGLFLAEWEGAIESIGSSFSLVEHLNDLYIVKSGGVLPNAAGIYRVVPGDPPVFPETRLNGKDVFIVHRKSGFVLPNQTNDCRVFSAPLIQDADCARFTYNHNRHDNLRPCQSELLHSWCSAAWAVMQAIQ